MINKIKYLFKDKSRRVLLENILSLSALQWLNYILPLITLPYIFRIIGSEKFGIIVFAQAFIIYFSIFIDYGFNLSATKAISVNRKNINKLSEIYSSVTVIRTIFFIFSFFILTAIIFSFSKFKEYWFVFYFTFLGLIGDILFPHWFFQGIEKMKYITFINFISRILFVILIFVFIHRESDYYLIPLLNSLGAILGGLIAVYMIFSLCKIKFYIPSLNILLKEIKKSTNFFLSRIAVSLYTSSNVFILGIFTTNQIVGLYAVGEKLYFALHQLYHPFVNALYPYVAHKKNILFYKNLLKIILIVNIFLLIFLFIFSDFFIQILFGFHLEKSVTVFRILLISLLVAVPSMLIGYPLLAALNYEKYANFSVIFGSVFHISMLILLGITGYLQLYTVATLVVITETLVFLIRLYGVIKHNLLKIENK